MFRRVAVLAIVVAVVAVFLALLSLRLMSDTTPAIVSEPVAAAARPVPAPPSFTVAANASGHYLATAYVDGSRVDVMVDTGASVVALTPDTARSLGIHPAAADYTVEIATAGGPVAAAPVQLREVSLGNVAVRNVAAVVIPGGRLERNLLGMSFLSRLSKFEAGAGRLLLIQ
jgi:aspartyl protease family protein